MSARPSISAPRTTFLKVAVMSCITVFCAAVLWQQIKTLNFANVGLMFTQISLAQWCGAALATFGSFAALGHYDALWHKALRTGVPPKQAHRTGMAAVAIGQTLGLAAVTSSLVRWHRFPQLSARQIVGLTATVSLSFIVCWTILLIPALWFAVAESAFGSPPIGVMCLILGAVLFACYRLAARYGVQRRIALQLLAWTSIDLICAALVLAMFLPSDVPLVLLISAVIIAFGAGLLSNAPGGIGAFDLTLILLLPMVPLDTMVSALLAYRLIYILIPFVIAAASLTRRPLSPVPTPANAPASWGVARQSGYVAARGGWSALMGETVLSTVAIGDPVARDTGAWVDRIGAVYKCSSRLAGVLRKRGWRVATIAQEARLNPQTFTTTGSKRQSLRRKLRKAADAGVHVSEESPDIAALSRIAARWAADHGGELGFSMGRFDPDYIAEQRVFLIKQDGALVGFVTFHQNQQGWALDLIRYLPDLPSGAIQMAVVAALETAKTEGATQFCLGAVPSLNGWLARFAKHRAGLVQFKQSFYPTWHSVYHAARTPFGFVCSALAVIWEIQRPLQNLRYRAFVIMIMQAFHLKIARMRGIAIQTASGHQSDDQPPCPTDERPRLASG